MEAKKNQRVHVHYSAQGPTTRTAEGKVVEVHGEGVVDVECSINGKTTTFERVKPEGPLSIANAGVRRMTGWTPIAKAKPGPKPSAGDKGKGDDGKKPEGATT